MRALALAVLLLVSGVRAADLPVVSDEVDWKDFRPHCQELLKGLGKLKASLPAATDKAVRALLVEKPADAAKNIKAIQKLLDAHCLLGVHINPESRVKAARGPLGAGLVRDTARLVLVKVNNEGGVTHPLRVSSPQFVAPGKKDSNRWLEGTVSNEAPFASRLSGKRLEYRVLRLVPKQAGKREATLEFNVGQGTQDLGFRAEVPILFTVKAR